MHHSSSLYVGLQRPIYGGADAKFSVAAGKIMEYFAPQMTP